MMINKIVAILGCFLCILYLYAYIKQKQEETRCIRLSLSALLVIMSIPLMVLDTSLIKDNLFPTIAWIICFSIEIALLKLKNR